MTEVIRSSLEKCTQMLTSDDEERENTYLQKSTTLQSRVASHKGYS